MSNDIGVTKLIELMNRLDRATERGQISWTATDREAAFLYSTASSSIIVGTKDNDGQLPFELLLLNEKGSVIDTMISHRRDWIDSETWTFEYNQGGQELEHLYERVRRAVSGIDAKIDEILASLPPDDDPYPF